MKNTLCLLMSICCSGMSVMAMEEQSLEYKGLGFLPHEWPQYIQAPSDIWYKTTLQGQEITFDNWENIAPQPDENEHSVIQMWKDTFGRRLFIPLARYLDPTQKDSYKAAEGGNKLLQKYSIKNFSRCNFVFPLDAYDDNGKEKKLMAKIAGPHRFEQINALLGRKHGHHILDAELWDLTAQNKCRTYQTLSRVMGYLLYVKWKKQNPNAPVCMPKSYVVSLLSGSHPAREAFDDKNCMVFEEYVEHIGTPKDYPDVFLKAAPYVRDFIVKLGLWCIHNDQFLIQKDGTVVYIDPECPNNTNPVDLYNKKYKKVEGNIGCGLGEFDALCKQMHELQAAKAERTKRLLVDKTQ